MQCCASVAQRLNNALDMRVVGTAGNADDAIDQALRTTPDIVLMDIDMPGLDCFDAARTIQARCPETRVIFVSAFCHDEYIEQALAVEAAGYITKSEPIDRIVEAIRKVASGGSYYSEQVLNRIVVESRGTRLAPENQTRVSTLTRRETEVLKYIASGSSQKQIAQTMNISAKTVHSHSMNLMTTLGIHDRVELTRFAIREGLSQA